MICQVLIPLILIIPRKRRRDSKRKRLKLQRRKQWLTKVLNHLLLQFKNSHQKEVLVWHLKLIEQFLEHQCQFNNHLFSSNSNNHRWFSNSSNSNSNNSSNPNNKVFSIYSEAALNNLNNNSSNNNKMPLDLWINNNQCNSSKTTTYLEEWTWEECNNSISSHSRTTIILSMTHSEDLINNHHSNNSSNSNKITMPLDLWINNNHHNNSNQTISSVVSAWETQTINKLSNSWFSQFHQLQLKTLKKQLESKEVCGMTIPQVCLIWAHLDFLKWIHQRKMKNQTFCQHLEILQITIITLVLIKITTIADSNQD